MSKTFEEMNKAELQEVAELYKVTEKVMEVAKEDAIEAGKAVPKVPNNDTYIKVLNEYKDNRNEDAPAPQKKGGKVGNSISSSGKDATALKKDYATEKVNVTITDHNTNVSTDEELEDLLIPVRWGNKQGRYTDHIPVHGNPTHVRQGAIDILKTARMTVNQTNKTGARTRFKVMEEAPMTEADLTALAEAQASRKVR